MSCVKSENGSCAGCNILGMIASRVDSGQSSLKASKEIAAKYCPDGQKPQIGLIENSRIRPKIEGSVVVDQGGEIGEDYIIHQFD